MNNPKEYYPEFWNLITKNTKYIPITTKLLNDLNLDKKSLSDIPHEKIINSLNDSIIIMDIRSFKQLLILSNNKTILKYFLDLQDIHLQNKEYEIKILQKQKSENFKELYENQMRCYKKNQYFYIATSDNMKSRSEFKIGGTENLHSRINSYNSGRSKDELMYCVYYSKVYNYALVEQHIQYFLSNFRTKNHQKTENFKINFNTLKYIVEMVITSIEKNIDNISEFFKSIQNDDCLHDIKPVNVDQKKVVKKQREQPSKPKISNNDEEKVKDWLFSIVKVDQYGFVSLNRLRERYRMDFPHEDSLKNEDINKAIKLEFNNKGVRLMKRHNYYIDNKRFGIRSVFLGYTLKE